MSAAQKAFLLLEEKKKKVLKVFSPSRQILYKTFHHPNLQSAQARWGWMETSPRWRKLSGRKDLLNRKCGFFRFLPPLGWGWVEVRKTVLYATWPSENSIILRRPGNMLSKREPSEICLRNIKVSRAEWVTLSADLPFTINIHFWQQTFITLDFYHCLHISVERRVCSVHARYLIIGVGRLDFFSHCI